MHSRLLLKFALAAVLGTYSWPCCAQVNPEVFSVQNPSPAAVNRNGSTAPASIPPSQLRMVPEDFAALKLSPGFLLHLNVLDDNDFTGEYRVDDQGNIAVPILGTLHVNGLTTAQAGTEIKTRLAKEQILKDPQVSLTVLEFAAPQVAIIGEVTAPGKYPLLSVRNLVDVLALAGGPTNLAGNEVQITRAGKENQPLVVHYSKASDPKDFEDILVHPGDTVKVNRAGIVYVLGAVNRPGGYVMQESGTLNVLQAISLALGTSAAASTKRVYLLRRNPDGTGIDMELAYRDISQGKASDIPLQPRDVLYVPTSRMKSIFTSSQQVINAAGSAAIYKY